VGNLLLGCQHLKMGGAALLLLVLAWHAPASSQPLRLSISSGQQFIDAINQWGLVGDDRVLLLPPVLSLAGTQPPNATRQPGATFSRGSLAIQGGAGAAGGFDLTGIGINRNNSILDMAFQEDLLPAASATARIILNQALIPCL
jgi:hypothetical protein